MKSKNAVIVFFMLFFGLAAHLIYASRLPVGNDEGAYLYDSWLVSLGRIPFVDFTTRSPLLLFVVSWGIRFLGNQLFFGRVVMSLSCVITAYVLYRIGSVLYNDTVGLLACFFYAVNPFLMAYGTTLFEEPLSMVFISSSLYLLILGLDRKSGWQIMLGGMLAGLAFLVRLSSAVILPVTWVTLMLYGRGRIRSAITNLFGFMIPLVFFLFAVGFISGFRNFGEVYPLGNILHVTQKESSGHSILSIEVFDDRLVNFMASMPILLYIIPPGFVFLKNVLKRGLAFSDKKSKDTSITLFILFVLLFLYYLNITGRFDNPGEIDTLWAVMFMGATLYYVLDMDVIEGRQKFSNTLVLIWLLFFVLFYMLFYRFREHYFTEFLPPLSIMAAAVFGSVRVRGPMKAPAVVFILIISLALVSSFKFTYQRSPLILGDTYRVAGYISNNTRVDEEIFSAAMVYPYLAGRRTVLDISHPQSVVDDRLGGNVTEYVKSRKIRYVMYDNLMYSTYFHCCAPVFEKLISEEYVLDEEITNKTTEHLKLKVYKRV